MKQNYQSLKDFISEKLEKAPSKEILGLQEDHDPLARLLAIEGQDDGFVVTLSGENLQTSHKVALESYLLDGAEAFGNVLIYFKRKLNQGPQGRRRPAAFTAVKKDRGPFGFPLRKKAVPGVQHIIAVSSGKGGVGKSTVSVNLAVSLARQGKKVGLLDADIYGPSAPLMLGLRGPMAVVGGNKIKPLVGFGVECVSFGFMADEKNPVIWRGPMVSRALEQLFYQTAWSDLEYLIVDMPPGTGDVQLTMIERLPIHSAIIVSTPQNVALLDAHKGLAMFQKLGVPVLGIVENMAFHVCSACGHEDRVFGDHIDEFSAGSNLPVIARIPLVGAIREASDSGEPIAAGQSALSRCYFDLSSLVVSSSLL